MDKRNERMLEEVLKASGNNNCADCHKPAPRWASVNLGIFLCVGCASIHRKMGTHRSRVKSVTMDEWTREQITHMRSIGNTASNKVFNPNEALHPPPSSTGADERDSEMEKYIRRKYEQQAFKVGGRGNSGPAPTSLNRARERDGRMPASSSSNSLNMENKRNPELNDLLVKNSDLPRKERDLPALPLSANHTASSGSSGAAPRARPAPTQSSNTARPSNSLAAPSSSNGFHGSANGHAASNGMLVDVSGSTSSTLPPQINSAFPNQSLGIPQSGMATSYNPTSQSWMGSSPNGMGMNMGMSMGMGVGMQGTPLAQSAPSSQQAYNPFFQQQQQQQPQAFQGQTFSHPQSFQSSPIPQQSLGSFPQQSAFPSQNPFGGVPSVTSPYGQSAMNMGMQHANTYFPGQVQGQAQSPMQNNQTQWNGMAMGMGMNMPMGMVNNAGQYAYHA